MYKIVFFLIHYFFSLVVFSQSIDFEFLEGYVSKNPVCRVMMAKSYIYENKSLSDYQLFINDIEIIASNTVFNEKAIGVNGLTATLFVGDSILLESLFYDAIMNAYKRNYKVYCRCEVFSSILSEGNINWLLYFKLGVKERIEFIKNNYLVIKKSDSCLIRKDLDSILGVRTNKKVEVRFIFVVWERALQKVK